jgi:hypothetical protein
MARLYKELIPINKKKNESQKEFDGYFHILQ